MTYKLLVAIFQLIFMLKTNNKICRKIYKAEINKKRYRTSSLETLGWCRIVDGAV